MGARTISGFDFFAACTRLDERLAAADIVVSGEGRFDATSLAGKGPGEVLRRALAAGKRAVVVCGALDEDVRRWLAKHGVAATSLADRASSPETAMRDGERLLEEAMAELRT